MGGLCQEPAPKSRALGEKKTGGSYWFLGGWGWGILIFLCSGVSFLSHSPVFWPDAAGHNGPGCLLPHWNILALPSHLPFICQQFVNCQRPKEAKVLKDHQATFGGESLSCSVPGRGRYHPSFSCSCFLLVQTFLWNSKFCIITPCIKSLLFTVDRRRQGKSEDLGSALALPLVGMTVQMRLLWDSVSL